MSDASAPQRLAPTTDGGPVGPVMVIGGAEDKLGERVILSRFVELAGGDQAQIVVISTASSLGDAATDLYRHLLGRIGARTITGLCPETREEANDPQLKQGLQSHLRETENHVRRLDQVFQMLGQKAKSVDCPAIDGILEEADDVIGDVDDKDVLDAAMIAAAQAVEPYEISRYGALIAWAKQLGRNDCARILEQTLQLGSECRQRSPAVGDWLSFREGTCRYP